MRTADTSISRQLLKTILSIYVAITLLVTLVQMGVEYLNTRAMIQTELERTEKTFYPALAAALWELNNDQLEALERGIANLPTIASVRVVDPTGRVLAGTVPESKVGHNIEHTFKVLHRFSDQEVHLADVTFASTDDVVFDRVKLGYQMILLNALIKSTALIVLFVWAFRRHLELPLSQLAEQVSAVDLDTLGRRLIDLKQTTDNELSRLENAFNRMLEKLDHERQEHDAKLEALNQGLESEVRKRTEELEAVNKRLAELSSTDGLTNLANRRKFDEFLASEWLRAIRSTEPLAVIMLDVDYFKRYNDYYGHQAGDECLKRIAGLIESKVRRGGELAARYGGEEFVVIAANSNDKATLALAQAICAGVEALALPHEASPFGLVSVSVGVACVIPNNDSHPADLLRLADAALYRAKADGRNRVEV